MPKSKFSLVSIILLVLAILFLVGGIVWLVIPEYNKIFETRVEKSAKAEEIDKLNTDLEVLRGLEADQEKNKKVVEKLLTFLPDESDVPELLVQLENIAYDEAGVGLPQLSFEYTDEADSRGKRARITTEGEGQTSYKALNVSSTVVGSYKNMKLYLATLERNLRLIDVTSIDFSSRPVVEDGPKDIFSYTINFKTYYLGTDNQTSNGEINP